jgi:hypothetical protein
MKNINDEYLHDPTIHAVVDSMEKMIYDLQLTPVELRQCATLASIHYEERIPIMPRFINENDFIKNQQ